MSRDRVIETSQGACESPIRVTDGLAIESSARLRPLLMKAIRKGTNFVLVLEMSGLA